MARWSEENKESFGTDTKRSRKGNAFGEAMGVDNGFPPIVVRLNMDRDAWLISMQPDGSIFGRAMGDHELRIERESMERLVDEADSRTGRGCPLGEEELLADPRL